MAKVPDIRRAVARLEDQGAALCLFRRARLLGDRSQDRRTHIHRDPGADGYARVTIATRADLLTPLLVPSLALRLMDLRLD